MEVDDDMNLSNLFILQEGESRSISAENKKGLKGEGGKEASKLGVGRKGSPCISINSGEEATLVDINGSGVINHFWITVTDKTDMGYFVLRDLVLKMYWDHEETPSVEVPLGDFFCNGFGERCNVNSLPIAVLPTGGMNCYIPMPFRKSAKITITNENPGEIKEFFYQFNYTLKKLPENIGYFHAQWRRQKHLPLGQDYVILDHVKGSGQYIGTYIGWNSFQRFWWGEGEVKIYLDGDQDYPTICGTGLEDYFGGAWSFYVKDDKGNMKETTYSTPFLGYPYYSTSDKVFHEATTPMHGLYRWHILDPIIFHQDIKITVQQIGNDGIELFERSDDICSVAYWYQEEPHREFPKLPSRTDRQPR